MISVFLPFRKGSERVRNKNFKSLPNLKYGLFENKIKQLIQISEVDEIILSTDYNHIEKIIYELGISFNKLKIIERPKNLCLSNTPLIDLITYSSEISSNETILWSHLTSPFFETEDYLSAIIKFLENKEKHDSLVSVTRVNDFIWKKSKRHLINVEGNKWPRTQDLNDLFSINNAVFIFTKKIYKLFKNRIGENPYLFEIDKWKSLDIDDEFDFSYLEYLLSAKK